MHRRLRRFLRNGRAVTPVLSNILLMVVSVAAMALATTATYVITTNLRENMSERLVAEDLWFNNITGEIDIYLRNVGKIAIHVSGVYVNGTLQVFAPSLSLEVGRHAWLNVSHGWIGQSLYYVDVVTTRGTHVGGYYKAP